VNPDVTALTLGVSSGLESDLLGTTALSVLDDGAASTAGVNFFARRSVRHFIMTFDLSVLVGRNLVLRDRHVFLAIALDSRLVIKVGSNTFALERSATQQITFTE
jgi:hypothetical protein